MIYLVGGPPHQDMYDLKMDAPVEIRGEFQPISTSVPGIHICEHLPRMAGMMQDLVPIRSIVGSVGRHDAFQCMTGRNVAQQPQGGWPSIGATVSSLHGNKYREIPAFVGLSPKMKTAGWGDPGQPGFLGAAHGAFRPNGDAQQDMVLKAITLDRLSDRNFRNRLLES